MKQPDIEIYLLSCPNEKIIAWLENHFSILEQKQLNAEMLALTISDGTNKIKVQILEQAAGKRFTSVWFDSNKTPWESDIDCARDAYKHLNCEIRCNAAGWQETGDEDPDQWWHINQYEEGLLIWK